MGGPRRVLVLTTNELDGIRELLQLVADDNEGTIDHRLVRRAKNLVRQTTDVPLTDVPVLLTVSEARAIDAIFGSADVTIAVESELQSRARVDAATRAAKKVSEALLERQLSRKR